jgi:hypothetical protein
MAVKRGQIIKLSYEGRDFDVVVIDPDGLGKGQPTVGFGFRMMEKNAGIPASTLSTWVFEEGGESYLKLPSGKVLRVFELLGSDGNIYSVIDGADWFDLVVDLLVNPGQTGKKASQNQAKGTQPSKSLKEKLGDFLRWFGVKGFYAEAYTVIKGVYTAKDSRALSVWMEARLAGIYKRKTYTDFLLKQGCKEGFEYAKWTDVVYTGLFGKKAKEMKQIWEVIEGDRKIARNYIPEAIGIEAVAYCEKMVPDLYVDSLEQAHEDSINYTKRRFFGGSLGRFEEN